MANTQPIVIPDIGDFSNVNVIEVLVKVGDDVAVEDSLIILESDKASMEIPAISAGRIATLTVKVGDKVSAGDQIGTLEIKDNNTVDSSTNSPSIPKDSPSKDTLSTSTNPVPNDNIVDLVVLGAGPGGYSAAFRAADLGLNVTLIERYQTLGGVCLNVGCIPSKALLHVAEVIEEADNLAKAGVTFAKPTIELDTLRTHKENVIKKLTTGLAGMAKMRKVNVITGVAEFSDAHTLIVNTAEGKQVVRFAQCIIAAGSSSIKLPFMPEDPRVIDSTGALKLQDIPKRMLVIGGGIIGLEMATVYHTLGSKIDIVEMLDGLMPGADRDAVKVWQKYNPSLFEHIMTSTKTVGAKAKSDGIYVSFEGENAPTEQQRYDRVLVAVGRRPNGKDICADKAGVTIDNYGFIPVDKQMRTNQAHIFAIGDIIGQPMLAHKAVHEGHIAAEVAAGHKAFFDARVIPSVAYTSPEVAWVGLTETQAKIEDIAIEKAVFPWSASGRAIANGCEDGFTKIIIDKSNGHVIGGAIVGPNAGDMISEISLAIEMNAEPADIALTIHPHPTLGETIGLTAEIFEGSCTDLPPQKKK